MEVGTFGMDGAGFRPNAVQPHRQWALFFEDHWGLRHDLGLTLGARYDDHNMFGGNTSPRVYLNWQATGHWMFKGGVDRKSTRLNSSHVATSHAVFCLKKQSCATTGGHRRDKPVPTG